MPPPSRQASPQERPHFDQHFPSPQRELGHENPRDSPVDLDRNHLPQSGRNSPLDLNEQDQQAAAAQENMLQAQAAALRTLLSDNDEANPQQDNEELPTLVQSRIEHVNLAQKFIQEILAATLENGNLDPDVIERLRNPKEGLVDISDPDIRLSLDLFMACEKSSQSTYTTARDCHGFEKPTGKCHGLTWGTGTGWVCPTLAVPVPQPRVGGFARKI